jgi:hypothetical protein
MRKLRPGNVLKHTYPSGYLEYARLVEKEKMRYPTDRSSKRTRTQVMWRVDEWDECRRQWKSNIHSFRGIQHLQYNYEEVNKLERLLVLGEA